MSLKIAVSFVVVFGIVVDPTLAEDEEIIKSVLLSVENPDPDNLPSLGVWEFYSQKNQRLDRFLSADFPNVPGLVCDLWIYESPGIEYVASRPLEGGQIELRHAWEGENWEIVTTATPAQGVLDLVARLTEKSGTETGKPTHYPDLNVCMQLRLVPNFRSKPDPYPQFVKRCFIYTAEGPTFLLETRRNPVPKKPLSHKRNNPPWVQTYLPESAPDGIKAGPGASTAYSPDRYRYPIIGVVSRDGKHLVAIGTASEGIVSQAWIDCLHNNARWLPASDGNGKQWRIRLYAMENDNDALLARFKQDFPQVQPWK